MEFPRDLWPGEDDCRLVEQAIELFESMPVVLTDELANSVFFNERAEKLFGGTGEGLVNRAACSLLGYDRGEKAPGLLAEALLAKSGPFRTVVRLPVGVDDPQPVFVEASAVVNGSRLVCGVLRFSIDQS
ncbi:hypothetical protein KQI84_04440 [bacterium]|nr:hypothetical protein [bacterium]